MEGFNGVPILLAMQQLIINGPFQRPLNKKMVNKIAAEFDGSAGFGSMTVVKTEDKNRFQLTNGLTRFSAGLKKYGEAWLQMKSWCLLVDAEAWRSFELTNTSRGHTPNGLFKARLVGEQPDEVHVQRALAARDVNLIFHGGKMAANQSRAAAKWLGLYLTLGKDGFEWVLDVLQESFSRPDGRELEKLARMSDFLLGITNFLSETNFSRAEIAVGLYNADLAAADYDKKAEQAAHNYRRSKLKCYPQLFATAVRDNQ